MLRTRSLAFDFTLGLLRLETAFVGNSYDGGDQRDPSVSGFDFVEAEQQACIQAVLHGADVTLNLLAPGNHFAVGGDEVFVQLNFEVLAGMQFGGVESVLETDQESGALRDSIWPGYGHNGWSGCLGQERSCSDQ